MESDFPAALGSALASALARKGYATLTAVQKAVLDPALSGRDLRITSQTGSGKTVAIGLTLRDLIEPRGSDAIPAGAKPRALVVAPTRELAKQVEEELTWLYEPLGARVTSVTGGTGYRDERRALAAGPAVVVGTPGRLLEHLRSGAVGADAIGAVVLDEADRLLDLGFREDLEAILAFVPEGKRKHLVSATFPQQVRALADATQDDPVHVEGTRLGAANADIDHVIHLVEPRERLDAIVNLLLANPTEQMLVFARTRADVAAIARDLKSFGFTTTSLSGELEQAARNRALGAFKRGELRVLVATDVAARGIDVQDIARVVHAEPPSDVDGYTHRSGRTGRAGRKGTSSIIAVLPELARTQYLLRAAGVAFRFESIPSADAIRAATDETAFAELTRDDEEGAPGFDARTWALAKRVTAGPDVTRAIARLLAKARYAGPTEPRDVRPIEAPSSRTRSHGDAPSARRGAMHTDRARGSRGRDDVQGHSDARGEHRNDRRDEPRSDGPGGEARGFERRGRHDQPPTSEPSWVPFRVSWGREQGADARRLLAMACRRGRIRGADVGGIRVARQHSIIDVARHVADGFSEAAGEPDPREPHVLIRRERDHAHVHASTGASAAHAREPETRDLPVRAHEARQEDARQPEPRPQHARRAEPHEPRAPHHREASGPKTRDRDGHERGPTKRARDGGHTPLSRSKTAAKAAHPKTTRAR